MSSNKRKLPRGIKKAYYSQSPNKRVNLKIGGVKPEVIEIAGLIANKTRLVPSPQAIVFVAEEIELAKKVGTITSSDTELATKALFLAGAQNSVKRARVHLKGKARIQQGDIEKQWEILGIGNCPPHNCLRRTVIDNLEGFKNKLSHFGDNIDLIK